MVKVCGVSGMVWRAAFVMGLVFVGANRAQAQSAQIAGFVRDTTNAVVVGATLVLEQEATGTRREASSNDRGAYAFPLLGPGSYRLTIEAPSFRRLTRGGIVLTVGQQARIDVSLDVAAVEDRVSVEGAPPLINADDGTVGTTLERRFVQNLPLSGRSFQSLITLSPGVVLTPTTGPGGQFSVNGQRSTANYFTIDGVSANIGADPRGVGAVQGSGSLPGFGALGGTNNLVSLEAFQEVKVSTSSFAPEFGRTPGAQVAIVTRSGTNQITGSAFEYFRHDAMDANDWFTNNTGAAKPETRYNNFGGVLGGPVVQSRLFYFFSHESQSLKQPRTVLTEVPTMAARAAAPANVQPLLNAFPQPNGPALSATSASFASSFSQPDTLHATSGKVDARVTDNTNAFARVSYAPSNNQFRGGSSGTAGALSFVDVDTSKTTTVTAGATSVLSPRMVADVRLNYSRHEAFTTSKLDNFGGAVPFDPSALIPASADPSTSLVRVTPLSGHEGGFLIIGNDGGSVQHQFNLVGTVSSQFGDHGLKAGLDVRRLTPDLNPTSTELRYGFNTIENAIASKLASFSINNITPAQPIFTNWSAFLQDGWRVTPHFTLTYGLRYEINPSPTTKDGRYPLLAEYNLLPNTIQFEDRNSHLWNTTWSNVAPRIAAAYVANGLPGGDLVIRGGWGVYYDLGVGRAAGAFGDGFPFGNIKRLSNASYPLTSDSYVLSAQDYAKPGQSTVWAFPRSIALPKTYEWNATIEKSLPGGVTASVAGIGAAGRHLLRGGSYSYTSNPASPAQLIQIVEDDATSDYNALQIQAQRRIGAWYGTIAYTWSHSIDTASDDYFFLPDQNAQALTQSRGNSDFDIRHALSAAGGFAIPTIHRGQLLGTMLSNWRVDTVFTLRSGPPITPRYVRDLGYGVFLFRPDVVAGQPVFLYDDSYPGGARVNPAAFVSPKDGRQGNLGRNTVYSLGLKQVDLALSRVIPLSSHTRVELRAEMFNLFNTPNFGPYLPTLTSPLFGLSTASYANSMGTGALARGGMNPLFQAGGPRSTQLAVRFVF